jgi:RNA polymerase sigma-70 factor (ECF subfamily)
MCPDQGKQPLALTDTATGVLPDKETASADTVERDRRRVALMARAQAGEQQAYRRLLEDITPYIRALAAKRLRDLSEIEDAVQDVLLTVHAIRHTYDPARPFAPWLTAVANRRIIDRLRRQMRVSLRQVSLNPKDETSSAAEANLGNPEVDTAALRTAIERLPSGQRQAIKLLKLEEMSLKEAAAASGMSVTALKVATHPAMSRLRKMLAGQRRST